MFSWGLFFSLSHWCSLLHYSSVQLLLLLFWFVFAVFYLFMFWFHTGFLNWKLFIHSFIRKEQQQQKSHTQFCLAFGRCVRFDILSHISCLYMKNSIAIQMLFIFRTFQSPVRSVYRLLMKMSCQKVHGEVSMWWWVYFFFFFLSFVAGFWWRCCYLVPKKSLIERRAK